jgi:hypothetical protein
VFRLVQKKWESAEHRQCPETPHEAYQPCGLDRFAALNTALFPAAGTSASRNGFAHGTGREFAPRLGRLVTNGFGHGFVQSAWFDRR